MTKNLRRNLFCFLLPHRRQEQYEREEMDKASHFGWSRLPSSCPNHNQLQQGWPAAPLGDLLEPPGLTDWAPAGESGWPDLGPNLSTNRHWSHPFHVLYYCNWRWQVALQVYNSLGAPNQHTMPNGYLNPTRYPVFFWYLTWPNSVFRISFNILKGIPSIRERR